MCSAVASGLENGAVFFVVVGAVAVRALDKLGSRRIGPEPRLRSPAQWNNEGVVARHNSKGNNLDAKWKDLTAGDLQEKPKRGRGRPRKTPKKPQVHSSEESMRPPTAGGGGSEDAITSIAGSLTAESAGSNLASLTDVNHGDQLSPLNSELDGLDDSLLNVVNSG